MNTILIAGASRGIGRATAEELRKKGSSLVLSSRTQQSLEEAYSGSDVSDLAFIPCDFALPENIEPFAEQIQKQVGGISGLVYCAGAQKTAPLSQCKPADIRQLFELNTFSAFELVRCFSKKSRISENGASFVLISSLAAHEGAIGKTIYAATKGALEGFLPAAAAELAPRGIRLNIVVPGVIQTDMSMEFINKMTAEQRANLEQGYPLGLGSPEDAAHLIAFLLSEESRWITGQTFVLDGGHSIKG